MKLQSQILQEVLDTVKMQQATLSHVSSKLRDILSKNIATSISAAQALATNATNLAQAATMGASFTCKEKASRSRQAINDAMKP